MKVDLPQPLAPIRPYRFPPPNLTEIFSKRGLAPNCMVILDADNTDRFLLSDVQIRRMLMQDLHLSPLF